MIKVIHGVIHGRTIELHDEAGLADGQEVEVSVRPLAASQEPGGGLLRTEGALADDQYWDAIMDEVYRSRKLERRPPSEAP